MLPLMKMGPLELCKTAVLQVEEKVSAKIQRQDNLCQVWLERKVLGGIGRE